MIQPGLLYIQPPLKRERHLKCSCPKDTGAQDERPYGKLTSSGISREQWRPWSVFVSFFLWISFHSFCS